MQFANYPGSLGSKQRSSIWSCCSRVQRYWHCTKYSKLQIFSFTFHGICFIVTYILGLRADSASIPPSLQYPDFALGILLFGNCVFALSRWPVLGPLGSREALKFSSPSSSQRQGVSLLLRLSLDPDVAALHGAGGGRCTLIIQAAWIASLKRI